MQNSYSSNDYSQSALAVAGLMRTIGIFTNMHYTCDGSGTTSGRARSAFKNNFNYDDEIEYDIYDWYDIKNELIWGRPVLLGGYATSRECCGFIWFTNGHAWVADALREDFDKYVRVCDRGELYGTVTDTIIKNYDFWIYMNWGWKGRANGWYYSNELTNPRSNPQDYRWQKDMIIKIHP